MLSVAGFDLDDVAFPAGLGPFVLDDLQFVEVVAPPTVSAALDFDWLRSGDLDFDHVRGAELEM